MKKQIFILIMALAASVTMSFGQTVPTLSGPATCPVPRPLDPTMLGSDALKPLPGSPYTYEVSVPNPVGTKTFRWIVTQDQTFLTNGILNEAGAESAPGLHMASAGAELNSTTGEGTGEDIIITWKSFTHDPTKPVFVVIFVVNDDGTCTTQNLKVWQIEPLNAFTLDITNLQLTGAAEAYDTDYATCVSNIASATYDASGPGVLYDFGTDYLFFTVNAANFTTSWLMDLQLAGETGTQAYTAFEWAYANAPTVYTPFVTGTPATVLAQDPSGNVGVNGECVIIRVTLAHNKEEVLAPQTITLAVDGVSNLLPDLHYVDGQPDGFTNDIAGHILKPRPTILEVNPPAPSFLPKL